MEALDGTKTNKMNSIIIVLHEKLLSTLIINWKVRILS